MDFYKKMAGINKIFHHTAQSGECRARELECAIVILGGGVYNKSL
ncbi:hypothetical protein HMPREF0239_02906 [Clostridium sp. ATCC BAA-442]|nr:hypothetical protein HMPREF0239_02906 [Clostridium sp. ATCC BAA-442]